MTFSKLQQKRARRWHLVGLPNTGKSTFAARMAGPLVWIDADQRASEMFDLCKDPAYVLSDKAIDNCDPLAIDRLLSQNMPGSKINTIVVDSLTPIIVPSVMRAVLGKENGTVSNLAAALADKANRMRMLQDSITSWGIDTLWISHLQNGRDNKGSPLTSMIVSDVEIARLRRSLNAELTTVIAESGILGITVTWSRFGRSGFTLWDKSGTWAAMPETLETYIHTPAVFDSPAAAVAWAIDIGAAANDKEGQTLYNNIKTKTKPETAGDMAAAFSFSCVDTLTGQNAAAGLGHNGRHL